MTESKSTKQNKQEIKKTEELKVGDLVWAKLDEFRRLGMGKAR